MRGVLGPVLVLALLPLFSLSPRGQEQSGGVAGVVKDSSGGLLPGVTVEARSATGVGATTTVTDGQGRYRFPALPPARYSIKASLTGFAPGTSDAIIALGQMLTIDLTLSVGGLTESVEVPASSPLIDVKQNAAFTTIDRAILDRFPGGADFTAVAPIAPGARQESRVGGIQMDGSSGSENRFIIDGLDATELRTGTAGKALLLDFIQEVQVKSSGYNAEFGGSTGGVISAITKSGSNTLRGSAGLYHQGDWGYGDRRAYHRYAPYTVTAKGPNGTYALTTATYTPEGGSCRSGQGMVGNVPACLGPEGGLLQPDASWRYLSPVADVGGPIFKDRVWFYGSWAYARNDYSRQAYFYNQPATDARAPNGGRDLKSFAWYNWDNYFNYNVTGQLGRNVRLKFSGSNQHGKNRGNTPVMQPDNDPVGFPDGTPMKGYAAANWPRLPDGSFDQATWDRTYVLNGSDTFNNTYTGNVDWVVTPTLFVNATAGYFMYNTTTPAEARGNAIRHVYNGSPAGLLDVPASLWYPSGWADTISSLGTTRNIYDRVFVNLNASHFRSLAGQHAFKAGLRFERVGNDVYQAWVYPNVALYWGQTFINGPIHVSGKYGYYELSKLGTIGDAHSNNYSVWLQDAWSVNNRLTINAGVRAESETLPNFKQGVPDCAVAPNDPDCAVTIKFGMRDKVAPRLGFAYDIKGDGKWKAYGSYSRYFDITKLELPRATFGTDYYVSYMYTLDTYDFSTITCDGKTGCPGTLVMAVDWRRSNNQVDPVLAAYYGRPGMPAVDPSLKPVQTGDMQVGVDHELTPTTSLGVRYIHKWATRAMEDVGIFAQDLYDDPTGTTWVEAYMIANPGEGYARVVEPRYPNLVTPKPKRDYDAVELRLRKRFSRNWAFFGTYTFSRLWGNYPGLASSDEWGRNSPNVNRMWDNTVMSYDPQGRLVYGLLNSDRPHQLNLSGSYDFHFGTSVGAYFTAQSGLPNSTILRASTGGYPVFVNGRSDLPRLPTYYNLDLMVNHGFRLGGGRRLELQASFNNVLDLKRVTNYYYEQYGSSLFHQTNHLNVALPISYFYTPYDVNAAVALFQKPKSQGGYGGALWDNAFFQVPDQYSARRAIRVSAKIVF